MNWYTPTLASYRLRTVRVGVHMTLAAVAVLTLYPLLPDHDIVDQRPYYLIIALAAFGVMVVALLPWEGLLQSGFGVWAFYVWSCLDIVLISGLIAITGGGGSEFFVLYTLTSMFFAASYPPRAHLALLLLTAGCYGGTLWLVGNGIGVAVFFVRISMLSLIIYMMRFLSHELMTQNASMAARELAMREQAAALDRMRLDAEHLATHDSLTGLLNRGAWFAEATRRSPTALAIIDVDHFKSINDRYGHLGGDEVLRVLAGQLASVLTPVGIVGRIGGEEFGVIFDTDPNAAERHCAAAVESIAVTPITTPRGAIDVTISAGLAEWTPAAHSREASLSQTYDLADQALYEAKRTGRRRLVVYPRPVEALALHGPRVSSPSV